MAEGKTITFDSYERGKDLNEKEIRKTVYEGLNQESIVIEFNEGINIQHIMASASLPEFYDYEEINGRKFWDGCILSNTPIRELIQPQRILGIQDRLKRVEEFTFLCYYIHRSKYKFIEYNMISNSSSKR